MIADFRQLEVWLYNKLKPLCVADPVTLSQYVIALLKKDKQDSELKEICIEQLEVFLRENTSSFVNDLFNVLKTKSYISTETSKASSSNVTSKDDGEKSTTDDNLNERKRPSSAASGLDSSDSHSSKQKRKHSPDSKTTLPNRSRSPHSQYSDLHANKPRSSRDRDPDSRSDTHKKNEEDNGGRRNKHRNFDSRRGNNRDYFRSRDKNDYHSTNKSTFRSKYRLPCRSLEEKGFCTYGDKCLFDHGLNTLVISPSKTASVAISQLASSLINANNLMTSRGSDVLHKPPSAQPQSVVAAVLSNSSLHHAIPNLNAASIIPVYRPTPIQSQTHLMDSHMHLMTNTNQQQQQLALLSTTTTTATTWPSNTNYFDSNHRYASSQISKNIVPIPMVENMCDGSIIAPPAYEPDRPHISLALNGLNPAESTQESDWLTSNDPVSLSYTPSPIGESVTDIKSFVNTGNLINLHDGQSEANADNGGESRTKLYIRRIPWRMNDAEKIHKHFVQFGNVIDVVPRYLGLSDTAMVEFSSPEEAEKAFRSPTPMFSNRFIRITTWFRGTTNANYKQRNFKGRSHHQARNILDRLGTKPKPVAENPYAWLSLSNHKDWSNTCASDSPSSKGADSGGRSRWRLERNSTGDVVGSDDDESESLVDDSTATTSGEMSSSNELVKSTNHLSTMSKFLKSPRHFQKPTTSPYTQAHKQEVDALIWERRKNAALKHRQEQLNLLDKAREAHAAVLATNLQRISRLKTQLKQVMDQLEQRQWKGQEEKQKLLDEAKRLQAELESIMEAEKKHRDQDASNKKLAKVGQGSTTISAAALDALPNTLRQERKKQILEIQTELSQISESIGKLADRGGEEGTQYRRRIVELKRQLVDLETIRPSDLAALSSGDLAYGAGGGGGGAGMYPLRTQTKLDKRPRTVFVTGLRPTDVDSFQSALSISPSQLEPTEQQQTVSSSELLENPTCTASPSSASSMLQNMPSDSISTSTCVV